jgi:hypothetical protein
MTTRFSIVPHAERPGEYIVEVWIADQFVAAIYPSENDSGLRIVSKYLAAATLDERPPAAVNVLLDLRAWERHEQKTQ